MMALFLQLRLTIHMKHFRILVLVALLHFWVCSTSLAEDFFDTRYQYYQEDNNRIRVDSSYSLFSATAGENLTLDGSLLYSAISGASPTGLPAYNKGSDVPVVNIKDERYAFTLGATTQWGIHSLHPGISYSYESDYLSLGTSLQDTISLNQKNTELVLGFGYNRDTVGANGSDLSAAKRTYDWLIGINQIIDADTLLNVNVGITTKQGYLNDPYKRVLVNNDVLQDHRPSRKLEELLYTQITHYIAAWNASVEASYRLGHNDQGQTSHTGTLALHKYFFNKRLIVRPLFRYFRQSAANYYDTQFTGNPEYYSADYRVSALESFTFGAQITWQLVPDKFSLNLGYERYLIRGTDGKTAQSAYPDANALTAGLRYAF